MGQLAHYLAAVAVSLEYVDPSVRYPPGWAYDGKNDVRTANVPLHETWAAMEELVDAGENDGEGETYKPHTEGCAWELRVVGVGHG